MAVVLNQEWLNTNSLRNYPFREDMSLIPVEDVSVRLPNSLIVDCVFTVAGSTPRIYLASLMLVGNHINFTFKDSAGVIVTTINVDTSSYTMYDPILLYGIADYSDARGTLILGNISDFRNAFKDGNYTFTLTTTELEPCIIRPALRGVRSLVLVNNDIESEKLSGIVRLIAGTNMKLSYDATLNEVRFDALSVPGVNFNEICDCEDPTAPQCIKTINGISIDDVEIIGDGKCIEITKNGNELVIKDICSVPCCGCTELEFLTSSLAILESNLSKVEAYYSTLNGKLDEFINNALLTL